MTDDAIVATFRQRRRFRYKIAAEGLALTAVLWAAFFGFAVWHGGAHWPNQGFTVATKAVPAVHAGDRIPSPFSEEERTENLVLIVAICTFLMTKIWGMWRRTHRLDALAGSIILTNLAFLWVYLYATGRTLYPDWGMGIWWRRGIRWPLALAALWATVEVCTVPDLESVIDDQEAMIREIRVLRLENAAYRSRADFDRQRQTDTVVYEGLDRRQGPADRRQTP